MNFSNQHRMGHIDSIRGIAALLVLYHHVTSNFTNIPSVGAHGTLLYDVASYLNFGGAGVVAFFAISGFVICPSLRGHPWTGSRKFLIRRFFRLYPAFWSAIILILLGNFLWQGRDVDWSTVFGNASMLYSVFRVEPLAGLFWTLEVEIVFYLLCLVLFLCGWLHKPVMLFVVGLALMAVFQLIVERPDLKETIEDTLNPHWKRMPVNLAIMIWGGLFRAWYDDKQRVCTVLGYQIPVVVFVVALLFIILLLPMNSLNLYLYYGEESRLKGAMPFFWGLGLFIVGALYIKLNNAFFVWLGAISYSMYLLHGVVISGMKHFVKADPLRWGDMHVSVYLLACTVLTILLAGLVYRYVEKPAIRFGRYLS